MKFLNFSVKSQDSGDVELVFFTLGFFAVGVRLDMVPSWLSQLLRPKI